MPKFKFFKFKFAIYKIFIVFNNFFISNNKYINRSNMVDPTQVQKSKEGRKKNQQEHI